MRSLFVASVIAAVAACGDGDSGGGDDDDDDDRRGDGGSGTSDGGGTGSDDGGADRSDAFVPPGDALTLEWGPVTVGVGQEDTRCVVKRLGNDGAIRVGQFHNVLGLASHHFIIYRVDDTEERPEPFPCVPFTDALDPAKGSPLVITQIPEETITLPEGVAFSLEANQMIRLELHYINTTDQTQEVVSTATFVPMPDDEFVHEADFLFMGDVDIELPPNQASTLGPTYFPLPPVLEGSSFFAITGHEHHWGTNVHVAVADDDTDPGTDVYAIDDFAWDEPEVVYHDPPFQVPAGGGFRFTCEWYNGSDQTVTFGESANQEMCFFWAYYYPSKGAKVCFQTDNFGGVAECCPGGDGFICDYLADL
jgi:hypothetical protein